MEVIHVRRVDGRRQANLGIAWLRDDSLEDMDNPPPPEVIVREIVEDLTAALAKFEGRRRGPRSKR